MVGNLNFIVAPLLLALFGLPFGFASGMKHERFEIRFAFMFLGGSVAFTIWVTLLSIAGASWSAPSLVVPLVVASIFGAWPASRRDVGPREPIGRSGWDALAIVVALMAAAHLVLAALAARSTSIDLFYIWGVKGLAYAKAGGIDATYLLSPYAGHSHTTYPPLVPLVNAWSRELAGRFPWRAALVSSSTWVLLAYPVVLRGLRSRLPVSEATIASGVWLLGTSLAVASSNSSGNAEPPLLFFTTIAVVALVAREDVFPWWVAPIALGGLVLTKVEGALIWILLLAGAGLREMLDETRRPGTWRRLSGSVILPILALGTWIAFELRHGLPLTDAARESIGVVRLGNFVPAVIESLRYLEAGSGWIAGGIALVVIALSWRSWRVVLPALFVAVGVLGFLLVYYLHYQGDSLGIWVRWTLPRVSLSALSAALLAAAVASGGEVHDAHTDAPQKDEGPPLGDPSVV